jgi:hypothetical protein
MHFIRCLKQLTCQAKYCAMLNWTGSSRSGITLFLIDVFQPSGQKTSPEIVIAVDEALSIILIHPDFHIKLLICLP